MKSNQIVQNKSNLLNLDHIKLDLIEAEHEVIQ